MGQLAPSVAKFSLTTGIVADMSKTSIIAWEGDLMALPTEKRCEINTTKNVFFVDSFQLTIGVKEISGLVE